MNLETSMISDVPAGRNAAGPPVPTADPAGGDPITDADFENDDYSGEELCGPLIRIDTYSTYTACPQCGAYRYPLEPCPRCGR
jgi:hypothetical protein